LTGTSTFRVGTWSCLVSLPNIVPIPRELNPKLGQRDVPSSLTVSSLAPVLDIVGTQDVQLDCLSSSCAVLAGAFGFFLSPNPNPNPKDDLSAEIGVLIVTTGGGRGRALMRYRIMGSVIG
jgi:hypothetical protein